MSPDRSPHPLPLLSAGPPRMGPSAAPGSARLDADEDESSASELDTLWLYSLLFAMFSLPLVPSGPTGAFDMILC